MTTSGSVTDKKTGDDTLERMRTEWDAHAKENAYHYVESSQESWTSEEFYESGRRSVEELIVNDAGRIYRGADPKQMTMLEIGCGAGRMTRALAEIFGEVHAIDVSGEMIAKAREALAGVENIHFHHTNGTDLAAIPDVKFDFAFSFIVFQHIPEQAIIERYIHDVADRLKPGGLFKFQVQGYWRSRKEVHDSWLGCTITARDALRITDETGLRLEGHEGVGTEYFWLWLAKPRATRISSTSIEELSPDQKTLGRPSPESVDETDNDSASRDDLVTAQIKPILEERLREIDLLLQESELRLTLSDMAQRQREMLETEIERVNEWGRGLDQEIALLVADRDELLRLSDRHEQELARFEHEYQKTATQLTEARSWAIALDKQAVSLRSHLQKIYGSLGYRISRRLGLCPGPINEKEHSERDR